MLHAETNMKKQLRFRSFQNHFRQYIIDKQKQERGQGVSLPQTSRRSKPRTRLTSIKFNEMMLGLSHFMCNSRLNATPRRCCLKCLRLICNDGPGVSYYAKVIVKVQHSITNVEYKILELIN